MLGEAGKWETGARTRQVDRQTRYTEPLKLKLVENSHPDALYFHSCCRNRMFIVLELYSSVA